MKTLSEILDEMEQRANVATEPPWIFDGQSYTIGSTRHMLRADGVGISPKDACFITASRTDVPALVKALRRAMKFVHDVDIGCYDVPEKVEDEIAAILNGEKTDLGEKETK